MHRRTLRRHLLLAAVLGIAALSARRAYAISDPTQLDVGGSVGEHDAHVTCGPDVRVRNASAGAHFEHLEQHPDFSPGVGFVVDARGGFGSTIITSTKAADPNDVQQVTEAQDLSAN